MNINKISSLHQQITHLVNKPAQIKEVHYHHPPTASIVDRVSMKGNVNKIGVETEINVYNVDPVSNQLKQKDNQIAMLKAMIQNLQENTITAYLDQTIPFISNMRHSQNQDTEEETKYNDNDCDALPANAHELVTKLLPLQCEHIKTCRECAKFMSCTIQLNITLATQNTYFIQFQQFIFEAMDPAFKKKLNKKPKRKRHSKKQKSQDNKTENIDILRNKLKSAQKQYEEMKLFLYRFIDHGICTEQAVELLRKEALVLIQHDNRNLRDMIPPLFKR